MWVFTGNAFQKDRTAVSRALRWSVLHMFKRKKASAAGVGLSKGRLIADSFEKATITQH